jgi:hypothetical protein
VRGNGGWIVAADAMRADGAGWHPVKGEPALIETFKAKRMARLPDWLLRLLLRPLPRRSQTFQPRDDDERRIASALAYIPSDDREVWWRIGAILKSHLGEAGRAIWDAWSSSSQKFDPTTQNSTWRSFRGAGLGLGTLLRMAKAGGYVG